MPPLLADFIYGRVCELKCEKFLTRPIADAAPILRPMPVCRDMIQVAAQSGPPFRRIVEQPRRFLSAGAIFV